MLNIVGYFTIKHEQSTLDCWMKILLVSCYSFMLQYHKQSI